MHNCYLYNIERGYDGAKERLAAFNAAVQAKDWALAREISGFHGDTRERALEKAEMRKMKGWNLLDVFFGRGDDPEDMPMSEEEILKGYEIVDYAVSRDPAYRDRAFDYKECILGERWKLARAIVQELSSGLQQRGDKRIGIKTHEYSTIKNGTNEETETDRRARLLKLRERYVKLRDQGLASDADVEAIDRALYKGYDVVTEYGTEHIEATDTDVRRELSRFSAKPISDTEYKQFQTFMMRRVEDGDQAAYLAWTRFAAAVKKEDWGTARDIMRTRGMSTDYGKAKPMTAQEIQRFRARMQDIINKTNNPFAIQKLREFDRAVQDGNWALARKIAISSISEAVKFDVPRPLSDDKNTANTALAKRYRLIIDRIKLALKSKKLQDKPRQVLQDLLKRMKEKDLVELTPEYLDTCEKTLKDNSGGTSGLMLQTDIDAFETERTSKIKLLEQRDYLLREISSSIMREEDKGKLKNQQTINSLKYLYNEVDGLTQGEISQKILNLYDKRLMTIDKYAISTAIISDPTKAKRLVEAQERKQNLIGIIQECIERAENKDAITRLNNLIEQINSVNEADLIDGKLFGYWDKTVKLIDSRARSSKRRTQQEVEREAKMTVKKEAFIEILNEAINKPGTPYDVKKILHTIKDEVSMTSIDDLSDEKFAAWEKRYQTASDSDLTIAKQIERNDDNAKAIRERTNILAEANAVVTMLEANESTKNIAGALRNRIKKFTSIPDKSLTLNDVKLFREDLDAAQSDNPTQFINRSKQKADQTTNPNDTPILSNEQIIRNAQSAVGTQYESTEGTDAIGGQQYRGNGFGATETRQSSGNRRTVVNTIGYDYVISALRQMILNKTIKRKDASGNLIRYEPYNLDLSHERYHDDKGYQYFKYDLMNTDEFKQVLEQYSGTNSFGLSPSQKLTRSTKADELFYDIVYEWKKVVWKQNNLPGIPALNVDDGQKWWLYFLHHYGFMNTLSSGAVEQAVSLDRNGNIVDSQTGSATSVSLKTAPGGQIIHTHPDGSPTSATDIAAAIQNGQTAVTTLRSSGNVLGYSGQNKKNITGETISVKKNEQQGGFELNKALTDMTTGIQNGFNSIDTNRDVLVGIYDRLGDVIDAVSEHNDKVNDRIDITALKSYDLARKFTMKMTQKAKDATTVFRRPSVINISK